MGLVNRYLELDSGFVGFDLKVFGLKLYLEKVGPDLDWDLLPVTWGLLSGSILGS